LVARQEYDQVYVVVRIELFAKRVQHEIPLSRLTYPFQVIDQARLDVVVQIAVQPTNHVERVNKLHFEAQKRIGSNVVQVHGLVFHTSVFAKHFECYE